MRIWNAVLAALCLCWLCGVYLAADPEPPWDWRVAAAFLQAILSALAIFSAWWLQARKRQEDREEAERDTQRVVATVTRLIEADLAHIVSLGKAGPLGVAPAASFGAAIRESDSILRRQNLAHLPGNEAETCVLRMLQRTAHFSGMLEAVENKRIGGKWEGDGLKAVENAYDDFFNARSSFLKICGLTAAEFRQPSDKIKAFKSEA